MSLQIPFTLNTIQKSMCSRRMTVIECDIFAPVLYMIYVLFQSMEKPGNPLMDLRNFCCEAKALIFSKPSEILNKKTTNPDLSVILDMLKQSWFSGTYNSENLSEIGKVSLSCIQHYRHRKNMLRLYHMRAISFLLILFFGGRMLFNQRTDVSFSSPWFDYGPLFASLSLILTSRILELKFPACWFWKDEITERGRWWLRALINHDLPKTWTSGDGLHTFNRNMRLHGQFDHREFETILFYWQSEMDESYDLKIKNWDDLFPLAEFLSFSLALFLFLSAPLFTWYLNFVPSN